MVEVGFNFTKIGFCGQILRFQLKINSQIVNGLRVFLNSNRLSGAEEENFK